MDGAGDLLGRLQGFIGCIKPEGFDFCVQQARNCFPCAFGVRVLKFWGNGLSSCRGTDALHWKGSVVASSTWKPSMVPLYVLEGIVARLGVDK